MKAQYDPKKTVTVMWAYSRVGKPQSVTFHLKPVRLQALHETFLEARAALKASDLSTLFVATRSNGHLEYLLGRYCKDKLGRVTWREGWPHANGLLQITDRKPFQ